MTRMEISNVQPLKIADAKRSIRHVFVRDLQLMASIGVYAQELDILQRIRINVDVSVDESLSVVDGDVSSVVCYDSLVRQIRTLVDSGHIHLVETLAERIADMSLQDRRVRGVRVRVEKLDAVPDTASVGVEIERLPN
ncbi:dihydroneopterin aldolase [Govanella unica]|uniref:7,8-dihydroneopterin aldolase n=1 Tax=Govanella unica TaxID=2975056 RepID=A0A9X3TZR2_9PROT|nr:dihydroneopterin aldolase [Govania unica]MDA5194788.1 dihydroneopterin aldolase [Govania unica]